MKHLITVLLLLALALCPIPAFAGEGSTDITFEGTTYHLTFESAEIVDGQLNVAVGGFGNALPMRNGSFVIIAWASVMTGGEEVDAVSVNAGGDGVYTFLYDCDQLPDAVLIRAYEDEDNALLLWQDPDAGEVLEAKPEEPAGESETVEAPVTEEEPEPEEEPVPEEEPAEEEPAEEEPEPEEVREIDAASLAEDILDTLGNDAYRATYDALKAGEVIQKGSKGDTAKGLQQTLIALGQEISADGSVGPKTIAALNEVQAAFGIEPSEAMDAEGYAALLPGLLYSTDEAAARELLSESMGGAYDYMRGCALSAKGRYYSAKQAFEDSEYGDWESRAAACAQPWPKTGLLYKNSAVKGGNTELTIQFNSDADTAMLVKIYTTNDVLARTLFIGGTGKATASLPAGTYIIKDGTGEKWYGEEEAFGEDGYYEVMTFDDYGTQEVELKKNYRSTITVNVQEYDPNADSVGSTYENWNNF